jgi:hypothetical protein
MHTFMFLLGEHENRKHQFGRQHRLNKHSLRHTRARTQRCPNVKIRREQHTNQETREDTACNLRRNKQPGPRRRHGATQQHGKCNRGIEQATRYTEKHPYIDHETEGEDQCNIEQYVGRKPCCFTRCSVGIARCGRSDVGDLSA